MYINATSPCGPSFNAHYPSPPLWPSGLVQLGRINATLCWSPHGPNPAVGLTDSFPSDPLPVLQRLYLLYQHSRQDVRLQLLGLGKHRLSGWRAKLHFQRPEIFPSLYPQSLWKPGNVQMLTAWHWKGTPGDQRPERDRDEGEKLENLQAAGDWGDSKVLKWLLFSLRAFSSKIKSFGLYLFRKKVLKIGYSLTPTWALFLQNKYIKTVQEEDFFPL